MALSLRMLGLLESQHGFCTPTQVMGAGCSRHERIVWSDLAAPASLAARIRRGLA